MIPYETMLSEIPADVINIVIFYLTPRAWNSLSRTCKRLYQRCQYGIVGILLQAPPSHRELKDLYDNEQGIIVYPYGPDNSLGGRDWTFTAPMDPNSIYSYSYSEERLAVRQHTLWREDNSICYYCLFHKPSLGIYRFGNFEWTKEPYGMNPDLVSVAKIYSRRVTLAKKQHADLLRRLLEKRRTGNLFYDYIDVITAIAQIKGTLLTESNRDYRDDDPRIQEELMTYHAKVEEFRHLVSSEPYGSVTYSSLVIDVITRVT